MEIHHEELADVTRYIEKHRDERLEDNRVDYDATLKILRRYIQPGPDTPTLEVGTGTGWFPLLCRLDGIPCEGLEISPQLIQHAAEMARGYGLESPIRLGNVEEEDIGDNKYRIVICNQVFEHIENWRLALSRIYKALTPGGVFLFTSSNKWCPVSHEFWLPCYGWLPNQMRYALRRAVQGPDIMKLGIDYNQFQYPELRSAFKKVGFKEIYDLVDVAEPSSPLKNAVVSLARSSPIFKHPVLTFARATVMVGIK